MRTPPSKPRRLGSIAAVVAVLAALAAWLIWLFWHDTGNDGPADARSAAAIANVAGTSAKDARVSDKPLWRDLTPAQQVALAPLHPEWDAMDGARKKKWLEMSRRFGSMNRTEQGRVHERMRQWMRLTPEQRNLARENYNRTRKLAPGDKAATWESYKQLTPGEKQRLAQSAARKNAATANNPAAPTTIVAPTSCPAGTTRRGASCISLSPPASIPNAPVITQPAPGPVTPPAAPSPAVPAAPAPTAQPTVAPAPSNANG